LYQLQVYSFPLALFIDDFFGTTLRALYCSEENINSWANALRFILWDSDNRWLVAMGAMLAFCIVSRFMLSLRCLRIHTQSLWIFLRSLSGLAEKTLQLALIILIFVIVVYIWQLFDFQDISFAQRKATCDRFHLKHPHYCESGIYVNVTDVDPSKGGGGATSMNSSLFQTFVVAAFIMVNGVLLFGGAGELAVPGMLMAATGPIFVAYLVTKVIQWRIFGPLTSQFLLHGFGATLLAYTPTMWLNCLYVSLGLIALSATPLERLRTFVHVFYLESLRRAFFEGGEELPLRNSSSDYAPVLIVNSSINDYRRPTDEEGFGLFTFTPSFMGSARSGFIAPDKDIGLSQAMALSGAAFSISAGKYDSKPFRFWLALMNIGMGRWVRTAPKPPHAWLQSLPEKTILVAVCALLMWAYSVVDGDNPDCAKYITLSMAAWGSFLLFVALSFFPQLPSFVFCWASPYIRTLHQVLAYDVIAKQVPEWAYLSDGGHAENLGILPLLRRRCKRILVVDATCDPKCLLEDVRYSLQKARDERLCSFFNPDDPRIDVDTLVTGFVDDLLQDTLVLGMLYLHHEEESSEGIIIISKGRESHSDEPVVGKIRDSELRLWPKFGIDEHGDDVGDDEAQPRCTDLETEVGPLDHKIALSDLNGCCCECCHRNACGNCGWGQFPHHSTGNQFFTDTLFGSYARLGRALGSSAVARLNHATRQMATPRKPPGA